MEKSGSVPGGGEDIHTTSQQEVKAMSFRRLTAGSFLILGLLANTFSLFASPCGSKATTTDPVTVQGDPVRCGVWLFGSPVFMAGWSCAGSYSYTPPVVYLTGDPGTVTSDGDQVVKGQNCPPQSCGVPLFGACTGGECQDTDHSSVKTKAC